ncbi:putative F-box domain, galactose oxidase/kelch, beta-propeller, kelch-type beta propeller [Helianthus annuus]|nr:putative F-box domain, galactose oxidase/kelch, beta-propeller, kelch-type beta propeller [Helianthus annuus]KAJ0443383.1 putative F-box domain, galactose oxidase/kelch, beta-propeller, F-box associated interaction [Helianthus annuus]KAJ0460902.1 putative F-box domain, galactose oxidase/kelch, beta-propeller, kelch-type beta propeller [Helianthus annuus]KAJ0641329.1 putative F-box domain, galactose oxidase/kelch, beta-propeller, kelch-type beta propeller [Helianthus annuus]KAJ0645233.1 putat
MSDNISYEIQLEIMKRLPVESLIQCRSVSKTWKSMIDSSEFAAEYSRHRTKMQHIFVRYDDLTDYNVRYVSVVDDDTFPTNRVFLTPPPLVQMHEYYKILGCSHGLFCFYRVGPVSGTGKALLWNPSVRKTVEVAVPNVTDWEVYETVLGFGVCRETNDPTIVKITHIVSWGDMESASCIPWEVEVFTLSTGAWRSVGGNLPRKLVRFQFDPANDCHTVVINGVIYWFATMDGGSCNLIISYDITNEEFGEINLPNSLAHPSPGHWFILLKLRESLVVLDNVCEDDRMTYDVWMMEGGVSKSFTKLSTFSLNTQDYVRPMGFRKSGEHIIEIVDNQRGHLVVYEPRSEHTDNLGIEGAFSTFYVHPYMETLSLLDQPTAHREL